MNQLITVLERATNGLSTSTTISIYPISKVIGIYPTLTNTMGPNNYNKSEGREGRTVSGPILLITEIYFHQSKPTFYDTIFTGLFVQNEDKKFALIFPKFDEHFMCFHLNFEHAKFNKVHKILPLFFCYFAY